MKAFATLGMSALFLSLGTIVPALAQHEQEQALPQGLLVDFRAFNTAAIGSPLLTRGPEIGQATGTKPMTFTSSTKTMGITCTTRGNWRRHSNQRLTLMRLESVVIST
jgi:hypothetical protein